jgi:hypothetical protein
MGDKLTNFLNGANKILFHTVDVDRAERLSKVEELSVDQIAERMHISETEVIELLKEAAARLPKPIDLYVVWDTDVNSWNGVRSIRSMHQTLKGALAVIPDTPQKRRIIDEQKDRPENWSRYVYDFEGLAIEKRTIGA